MRTNVLSGHAIMEKSDIEKCPRCAGISAHAGVVILWDEDRDERVIELVDSLTDAERGELVAVHECEGCVTMFWRGWIPRRFHVCEVLVAGDVWSAFHIVGNGALREFAGGSLDLGPAVDTRTAGDVETAALTVGGQRVAL